MKQLLFLTLIVAITQFSCKKPDTQDPTPLTIEGKWRMVTVTDNATNISFSKPAICQGEIEATFTLSSSTDGSFIGSSWLNEFDGTFNMGASNHLIIPYYSMTKSYYLYDRYWGEYFYNNIRFVTDYNFDNAGKLILNTSKNISLSFLRL
jgi:hypothetical protein